MRYALINTTEAIVRTEDEKRIDLNAGVRTGYRWIPINETIIDNSTGADVFHEPWVLTVLPLEVTKVKTIRDQTAQEIQDAKLLVVDDSINGLQFKHLFILENRTRILESRPELTAAEYRTWLASQL